MNLSAAWDGSMVHPCNITVPSNKNDCKEVVYYTDADLASDMNAMSVQERLVMQEEIHGVLRKSGDEGGMPEETEEFVSSRIQAMLKEVALMSPASRRLAWEKAVFFKPSLAQDRSLLLMFLRARRFQPLASAILLVNYFETKRDLFGDELLIHRIRWTDLTEEEQTMVRGGLYEVIPGRERAGRGIALNRVSAWDVVGNPRGLMRCIWYTRGIIQDDPEMQRRGVVIVADFTGKWIASPLQSLRFTKSVTHSLVNNAAFRVACIHMLFDGTSFDTFFHAARGNHNKENRLRHRVHFGSPLELQYSLRSFGIIIDDRLTSSSSVPAPAIGDGIAMRQRVEEQWWQSEARFRNPNSDEALYPNPQDVILGRNKTFTANWPGNIAYNNLILLEAHRYAAAEGEDRFVKTSILLEIARVLKTTYHARFLVRRGTSKWKALSEAEIPKKISQSMRMAAQEIMLLRELEDDCGENSSLSSLMSD